MRGPLGPFLAALVAGLLACASASRGEIPAFRTPSAGVPLLSGTTVTVEWSPRADPADGIVEMELLLSLDGGRSFDLRVTGEIEPDSTHILWRVPELPARHARLALRTGNGSRDSERIRAVSEEFEIRRDPQAPPEPFFRLDGEWRTRDALDLPQSGPSPLGTIGPERAFFAGDAPEPAGTAPRTDPLEALRPASRGAAVSAGEPTPARFIPSAVPRLAPLPLRE